MSSALLPFDTDAVDDGEARIDNTESVASLLLRDVRLFISILFGIGIITLSGSEHVLLKPLLQLLNL